MDRKNRVLVMLVAIVLLVGTTSALAEGCTCEGCTCCNGCNSCNSIDITTEVDVTGEVSVTAEVVVTTNQIFDSETGSLGASMIICNRTQWIVGANSPNEKFEGDPFLPYQSPTCDYPSGITGETIVREKKWAKINLNELNNGTYLGMTHLNKVTVVIEAEDYPQVCKIVERLCSKNFNMEQVTINQETIILSTIYFYANTNGVGYAAHMFFPSYTERILVGYVVFGNGAAIALYRGDFDGDGLQELGFAPGFFVVEKPVEPDPIPEPTEPEPTKPEPQKPVCPKTPCQSKQTTSCKGSGCKVEINIIDSFNFLSKICQKIFVCVK